LKFSSGAGPESVNLTSNVAFALPGSSVPLEVSVAGCPANLQGQRGVRFVDVALEYPGIQVFLNKTRLCQIDLVGTTVEINPYGVGVIQGLALKHSSKGIGPPRKDAPPIAGVVDVLGDTLPLPDAPTLSKPKVPARESDTWFWVAGTVTAGTGAAPAWVLDGKLVPIHPWERGNTEITLFQGSANVGNNKIGGQSAKGVFDFCGPLLSFFHNGRVVGTQSTVSPTYETNFALNHRNFLGVGDVATDFGKLNQPQFVRTAIKRRADLGRVPKEGEFARGYAPVGWDLHLHTCLEGGGAIAPVTFTNSKTKKIVGTIPTYSIARAVPRFDGILQLWWLTFESDLTARHLFTTEHTSLTDKNGNPYLETVSGWKAVHAGTFSMTPGGQNFAITICYPNGFSAPTYQRANGVKIGVAIKF
jgi:hypothetical protein